MSGKTLPFEEVAEVTFSGQKDAQIRTFHFKPDVFPLEHRGEYISLKPLDEDTAKLIHRRFKGQGEDLLNKLLALDGIETIDVWANKIVIHFKNPAVSFGCFLQLIDIFIKCFGKDKLSLK